MNDADVQRQIRQMVAFIDQEAVEKATEIEAKAAEEFTIEKDNIVNQQKQKIIAFYQKKEKQIELQRKIQHSNLQNQSRVAILKAREDLIQKLKDDAAAKLALLPNDRQKYAELLKNLVAQCLYRLIEKDVYIKCREKDRDLMDNAVREAVALYKKELKRDVNVHILDTYLHKDVTGGVEAFVADGKIKVDNTLEARLEMLFRQMIPEIREKLFGKNLNRVHDN